MATFEAHQCIRFSMGYTQTIFLWYCKLDIWPWKFKVKVTAMDASANNDSMAKNEQTFLWEVMQQNTFTVPYAAGVGVFSLSPILSQ